jgi:DNA-binding NarL/FixJ family response regulator
VRLVICDDHRLLLDTLGSALADRGYTIDGLVTTADDVVRIVRERDPDIAIIDVHLAAGTGLTAAATIVRDHPRTKVLMLSASPAAEVVVASLEAGAAGFVRKDQTIDGIVRRLEQVAEGVAAFELGMLRRAVSGAGDGGEAQRMVRQLSRREREVLALLVEGRDTAQMARALHIADSTARTHVQNVLVKLGAHSRLQASAIAVQMGLLELMT